jgi:hypothetical protein
MSDGPENTLPLSRTPGLVSRRVTGSRPGPRAGWGAGARAGLGWLALGVLVLAACAPIVRPAPFKGARNQVTDTSLLGPFDGQIVDEATGEPVQDAVVVGVWSYDRGDGFIAPSGSETISVQTDEAGRYRIGRAPLRKRGTSLRLVSFRLVVYKRGYASYRSDLLLEGGARRDFTGRHNRIELGKWRDRDSHAKHLLFLAPPREVARVANWEQSEANLDLYRSLGGTRAGTEPEPSLGPGVRPIPGADTPEPLGTWLAATPVVFPEDVAMRTGFDGEFVVEDLGDFPRTDFYHGVLYRAVDQSEEYDFSIRVWHKPPGGLDPVIEIFRDNLPVEVSADVSDETWIYEEPGTNFRGVAFVDRESETGVLVSCGPEQCIDVDTAIILAKFIQGRLDRLEQVPAGAMPEAEPVPAEESGEEQPPATPSTKPPAAKPPAEPEPTPEPEPEPAAPEPTEPEPTEPEPPDAR